MSVNRISVQFQWLCPRKLHFRSLLRCTFGVGSGSRTAFGARSAQRPVYPRKPPACDNLGFATRDRGIGSPKMSSNMRHPLVYRTMCRLPAAGLPVLRSRLRRTRPSLSLIEDLRSSALGRPDVHENVPAVAVELDKAEASLVVKPLHSSLHDVPHLGSREKPRMTDTPGNVAHGDGRADHPLLADDRVLRRRRVRPVGLIEAPSEPDRHHVAVERQGVAGGDAAVRGAA